jgi:predicted AAA+ superfamily ATPase
MRREKYSCVLYVRRKYITFVLYIRQCYEQQTAIQACYSLIDPDTRKREVNALLQISKQWQITKHLIITKDEEETITDNAIRIEVIPVWKWLLSI